jgi:hypothetical protein
MLLQEDLPGLHPILGQFEAILRFALAIWIYAGEYNNRSTSSCGCFGDVAVPLSWTPRCMLMGIDDDTGQTKTFLPINEAIYLAFYSNVDFRILLR